MTTLNQALNPPPWTGYPALADEWTAGWTSLQAVDEEPALESGCGRHINPERITPNARNRACRRTLVNGVTISIMIVEEGVLDLIPKAAAMERGEESGAGSDESEGAAQPPTEPLQHRRPQRRRHREPLPRLLRHQRISRNSTEAPMEMPVRILNAAPFAETAKSTEKAKRPPRGRMASSPGS